MVSRWDDFVVEENVGVLGERVGGAHGTHGRVVGSVPLLAMGRTAHVRVVVARVRRVAQVHENSVQFVLDCC